MLALTIPLVILTTTAPALLVTMTQAQPSALSAQPSARPVTLQLPALPALLPTTAPWSMGNVFVLLDSIRSSILTVL